MATRSATAVESPAVYAASDWIVVACGDHRFGLPIVRVSEIIPDRPAARLPGCGADVVGLINLRGRPVTIVDLGAALGLPAAAATPERRILLVDRAGRRIGLAVAAVLGLAGRGATPASATGSPGGERLAIRAEVLRALDAGAEEVVGVGEWNGRPFVALDPEPILASRFG